MVPAFEILYCKQFCGTKNGVETYHMLSALCRKVFMTK